MLQSEEDIKTEIEDLYFPKSQYKIEKNKLDFAVLNKNSNYLYWAESKKGIYDKWAMIAQLILTIKPRIDKGELPPPFIGCFDGEDITFIEFHYAQEIFSTNDFNWNERPSSVSPKTISKTKRILDGKETTFNWKADKDSVKEFIKKNFIVDNLFTFSKIEGFLQITKNNFVQVFDRWSRDVLPSINIPSEIVKQGIMPRDFYLADLLSINNKTIAQKLKILLNGDNYEVQFAQDLFKKIFFNDNGLAHRKFWKTYERPPKKEYQKYMLERQDLLVPSGIRERKGAFFTPQIWVEKSQEYLAQVFGENWQDEYYIWDCCAGTGNLENGLSNREHIWASTLDDSDVRIMKENERLMPSHVFQFDFLNGSFGDLPTKLKEIINNPEKQKKLIIYINPPYGECGKAKKGEKNNKAGIASSNKTYEKFSYLGRSLRELFALFLARIVTEMPNVKLGLFSKLKIVTAPNFHCFRELFQCQFEKGFIVHANTFDNVKGNFPIGFTIWNMENQSPIKEIECDVIENDLSCTGKKKFYVPNPDEKFINDWIENYRSDESEIGFLNCKVNDFQNAKMVFIATQKKGLTLGCKSLKITSENLIPACIYLAVRQCIPATWLNDRDQFYYPNKQWETDTEFQNDCLIYTLFHSQNYISSKKGTNHWIPFTPTQVQAKDDFESNFMSDFLKDKNFSKEAWDVLEAGKKLWAYYLSDDNPILNINASLYEIREYHRGRNSNGRLCSKSADEQFQILDDEVKEKLKRLGAKISIKVFKYGFLK